MLWFEPKDGFDLYFKDEIGISKGLMVEYCFQVTASRNDFIATLVWNDLAGSPEGIMLAFSLLEHFVGCVII